MDAFRHHSFIFVKRLFLSYREQYRSYVENFSMIKSRDERQYIIWLQDHESGANLFYPCRSFAIIPTAHTSINSGRRIANGHIANAWRRFDIHHDPSTFGTNDSISICLRRVGRLFGGFGLPLHLMQTSESDESRNDSSDDDSIVIPVVRLLVGTFFLVFGGWLVYDYGDGASWTRKALSVLTLSLGLGLLSNKGHSRAQ